MESFVSDPRVGPNNSKFRRVSNISETLTAPLQPKRVIATTFKIKEISDVAFHPGRWKVIHRTTDSGRTRKE